MEIAKIELPDQGRIAWMILDLMYKNQRMNLKTELRPQLESFFELTEDQKSRKYETGSKEKLLESTSESCKT
ncbi:hypothetical protein ACOQFO_01320 [Ureibacillus sp. MALMAid1270]|uniref:hypothetical protein n=1 Tax=Ureibacillus sp. MALMAid1270 TaxID=3411629 RepID=UPI003BA4DCC4